MIKTKKQSNNMKRNTVTVIKYLVLAAFIITLGPVFMRFLVGDGPIEKPHRSRFKAPTYDDDDVDKIFKVRDWEIKNHKIQATDPPTVKKKNSSILFGTNALKLERSFLDMEPDLNGKIDWHNYKEIQKDQMRKGPGEQGQAHILDSNNEEMKKELYSVNGFNALASDHIALDRSLKDIRHPDCKKKKYLKNLLNASIIVPFHNEHWTTLLRTVASVLNRSPPHLIHEVILVDDFSNKEFLKNQLDDYLKEHYPKARVVRQGKREGLIRTRLAGAKAATGQVLIFLDSHVEATINWLPPLLEPISRNYKAVVCPFIDVIDFENFAYRAQDEGARGAFDWGFYYKRLPLLPRDLLHPAEPFKSPIMAGGLFAISTKWFWELGGYDPGLDIWGGEQYELSFKLWQCGGIMVDAPCSRVGHIYRKFAPFPNPGVGDFIARNYKRVAEVWMDEYKEFLYKRNPHYKTVDAGDISDQLAIREKLHCKPFKWFMTKIAFDLPKKYPMIEPENVASGEIRNLGSNKCVDTKYKGENLRFSLDDCLSDHKGVSGEQSFVLTWHKDIKVKSRNFCFDVSVSNPLSPVLLYQCHGLQGNQWWKYNVDNKHLYHPTSGQCLECDKDGKELFMNPCDYRNDFQKWKWSKVNETLAKNEWNAKKKDINEDEPPDSDINIY